MRSVVWMTLALSLTFSLGLSAQEVPGGTPARSGLPLHRSLVDFDRVERNVATPDEVKRHDAGPKIPRRDDGAVLVELVGPAGSTLPDEVGNRQDVEVDSSYSNSSELWIPANKLTEVAAALPDGYVIYPGGGLLAGEDAIDGQGIDVCRSQAYRDAGYDGSGLTIAVIDGNYSGFTASRNAGEIPPFAQTAVFNLTGSVFESGSTSKHGTACLETVYDHAPGAFYLVFRVGGASDVASAVDTAILLGADIITHSLSHYNYGWNDDEGTPCDAANLAGQNGVLFFTSAGNRAETHWQGPYSSPDGDNFHNWGGADETINVTISADAIARIYLSWDTSGGTHDYDLILYNEDLTEILAVSDTSGEGYEAIAYDNEDSASFQGHIAVVRQSGGGTELELFQHGGGNWEAQHEVAVGSTTSPSNATHPNVISIGAVHWSDYDEPSGTFNLLTNYSSIGPSNSSMTVPDLCGPTSTSGFAFGSFSGTSCSTPNAAGVAAVLWSCDPSETTGTVRNQLFDFANVRDWFFNGKDIFYGEGGIILPVYQDCNGDDDPDACDILASPFLDGNHNGKIDFCESSGGFGLSIETPTTHGDPLSSVTTLVASVMASEIVQAGGGFQPVSGFRITIATPSPDMNVVSVTPGPVLQELNGGQGPSVFQPIAGPDGVMVEVIFYTAPPAEQFIFNFEKVVLQVEIEIIALSAQSTYPIDFTPIFGLPNEFFIGQTGSATPTSASGTLITPTVMDRFEFLVEDLEVDYDPSEDQRVAVVRPVFQQTDGILDLSEAFSCRVLNDSTVLQPQSVTPLGPLNGLAGGAGPDFFDVSLTAGSLEIECVYDFAGFEAIPLAAPTRPFAVTYETEPGVLLNNLAGETTQLAWDPAGPNNVTSSTGANDAVTINGWITFNPEITEVFIRGDFDGNGAVGLPDVLSILAFQFQGGAMPPCPDAIDIDDSGSFTLVDPVMLLEYLFSGGTPPPPPGPTFCGIDPTPDGLGPCEVGFCPELPDAGQADD